MVTPYRDQNGGILFYILRTSFAKSIPVCWWKYGNGNEGWKLKMPLAENRPLLNLPAVVESHKIINVEGEKTCVAAFKLFPFHTPTTSCLGAESFNKSDFSPFKGKDILIWPDNDKPGLVYGKEVGRLAEFNNANRVKYFPVSIFDKYRVDNGVIVPQEAGFILADKFDAFDALQLGWTADLIREVVAL